MPPELIQSIVVALLTGGFVSGIFAVINKKTVSPESQNDLARLGNEFAAQLLKDAKEERAELRASITELEKSNETKEQSIKRLKKLLEEKDARIEILENHQQNVASKLQRGEPLTLFDIFGKDAPNFPFSMAEEVV